jgi:hypothetical protein
MAPPHVVEGGTAFNMEVSCEYIDKTIKYVLSWVVMHLWVWAKY